MEETRPATLATKVRIRVCPGQAGPSLSASLPLEETEWTGRLGEKG